LRAFRKRVVEYDTVRKLAFIISHESVQELLKRSVIGGRHS
jgi:hypothetical protein